MGDLHTSKQPEAVEWKSRVRVRDKIHVNEDQFTHSFSDPFPVFPFLNYTPICLHPHTQKQHMIMACIFSTGTSFTRN
jgi:hypothetical protein